MIIETANNHDMIKEEEEEDFISKLPDAILIQIISLLPEVDANRTRILSNRWKDLCSFLPNLKFVIKSFKDIDKFHDSVEQTLALRDGMAIQRLTLYCCWDRRVSDLFRTAVNCKIQQLVFSFSPHRYRNGCCSVRDLLKMCNSLVVLTLKGEYELDVPEAELLFPCLKKLDLVSVKYSGDRSVTNLIAACPVLEELFVERKFVI